MGGADKLLEKVQGKPILKVTAQTALAAGLGPVVVGLRPKDRARRKALGNLDVTIVEVADAEEGMAATLRAGARNALGLIEIARKTAGDYEYLGMMILLPDMPEITSADLIEMDRAFQSSGGPVVRAVTDDGKPGHPTLFPDHMLHDFESLSGDKGAVSLMSDAWQCEVSLPGNRARLDLDTPEDWAAWRKNAE